MSPARISLPLLQFRVFRFAWLVVLAVAVGVAPFKLVAQEATPAGGEQVKSVAAPSAEPAAKSDAGPTQEEQNNAFRLEGPLVKSTAKMLHISVEATARMFEFINFGIIFFAIVIPLFRIMPNLLRKRAAKVRTDIESARKVTEDANARLSAVEAKLSSLDQEIARFKTEVEEDSKRDLQRIKAGLEEETVRIVAAAEQEIGMAAAQARRGLRHFAADLAIDQATKQLVLTPDTDRALIAEFVGDVTKGGQN